MELINNQMNVTTFEDLKRYAQGAIVKLPGFAEGQPFVARLRRPDLTTMMASGNIPNALLKSAGSLFEAQGEASKEKEVLDSLNTEDFNKMIGLFDAICKEALIQPTYDEIIEAGMTLTMEQKEAIFSYVQEGVIDLDSFR